MEKGLLNEQTTKVNYYMSLQVPSLEAYVCDTYTSVFYGMCGGPAVGGKSEDLSSISSGVTTYPPTYHAVAPCLFLFSLTSFCSICMCEEFQSCAMIKSLKIP